MQVNRIHVTRLSAILGALETTQSKIEVPIGCALYNAKDQLVVREINATERNSDPTSHAEILAIRKAANLNSNANLSGYSIYITLEPCLMCLGAIQHANIKKVIFGAYSIYNSKNSLILDQFRQTNPQIEIIGGVLEKECQNVLSNWFKSIR